MRTGSTYTITMGDFDGHLITGEYEDGSLGQIFIWSGKQGSTLRGVFDSLSTAVSIGLQHGVPLESYVEKYIGQKYEPAGFTGDEDIVEATSVCDYIFRRLALDYLDDEALGRLNIAR